MEKSCSSSRSCWILVQSSVRLSTRDVNKSISIHFFAPFWLGVLFFPLSLSLSLYALIECDANLVLQRMRTLAEWTQEGKKSLILIWACPLSTTKVSFRFRWHSHRDWNREIARYDCSEPVWPDLTKFCHFGNTYYNLGQMVMVYLIFGKFLNLL